MTASVYTGAKLTRTVHGRTWFGGSRVDGKGPKDRCIEAANEAGNSYIAARDIGRGPKEYTHYRDAEEFAAIREECMRNVRTQTLNEIIRPVQPSWAYVDLDDRVGTDRERIEYIRHFKRLHDAFVFDVLGIEPERFQYNASTATRDIVEFCKISYHIIVRGLVLADIDARQYWCQTFARYIREHLLDPDSSLYVDANMLLSTEHASAYMEQNIEEMLANPGEYYDDKEVQLMVDDHIYGKDWCFRAVGMHKLGETDPLASLRICEGSDDVREHSAVVYPTDNLDDAVILRAPASWYAQKGSERKKVSQYSPRGHGVGSEQIARSIEAMAKVSPGSRIINVEEHAGEDGRTYYMSRWTVDPVVPCIVCKKDRPHKSAGHGPRVCEYSDARVTYSCWKKGPKHAECIMDRFEYVSESVEFTQVYCEDKVRDFDVSEISKAISSKEKHTYIIQSGMGTGKSEAIRALEKAIVKIHSDARIVNIFANVSLSRQEEFYLNKGILSETLMDRVAEYLDLVLQDGWRHYLRKCRLKKGGNGWLITDPRVLIVINSILRLSDHRFDIVVLDEVFNILTAFSNSLIKDRGDVLRMFTNMIRDATILIASDAYITAGVVDFIRSFRPAENFNVIDNRYVRPNNRELEWVDIISEKRKEAAWIDRSVRKCREGLVNGKKVILMASEAEKTVDCVMERLKDVLEGKNVKVYTARTPKTDLELGANEAWKDVDFLVYSPTISVGVSYTLETFDVMVCMLRNGVGRPQYTTSLQQMYRVRQLREGKMYVFYLDSTTNASRPPTSFADIKARTREERDELLMMMKGHKKSVLRGWGVDDDRLFGDRSPVYNLFCRNLEELGVSRSHYKERMIELLKTRYGVKIVGDVQPEESTKAPKLKKREKETHDWYILSDEEYSQLSERKSDREVLSAKELKLIDIYELCHKAYKIPRHLIDEDLAYLLAEEENRDMYRAREQYSRVTELGWEAAVGDIEDRARESSDIFALTANKKLSSMDKLTIAKELLRGSGVMEFCLDGGSAPGMVLSRENVLEVVNRVDKDYIYKFGSRFRSVFDYRRRSKNKAGKLEFDQCVSVLENMLKVTLDVDVTCIEGKGKGKASGVMVSKARMLEFLNRYRPAWLGEQAEIAESARATREFYRGMDGYQFLTR